MKNPITLLFVAMLMSISSCKKDKCECETCADGIMNQNETAVDCGGMCKPCGSSGGTITLQPNAAQGKDAVLADGASTSNYGNHPEFTAFAWTCSGSPCLWRSLLEFDLSSVPAGARIADAKLSLFAWNSPTNGSHSTTSGSNAALLQRVTSAWDESTVTWSTMPATTTVNQVTLPQSTGSMQHYPDINVTALVQDMVDNPANSHGFLLRIVTEQYYRSIVFASSDNTDSSLHPKLVVTYQ